MLCAVDPGTLERLRFPLGELRKPEVRERAAAAGPGRARKPDSQDLCFLAGTDRDRFLARHGGPRARAGDVVDRAGRVLGPASRGPAYTVGPAPRPRDRRASRPLYVLAHRRAANRVVVGRREDLRRTHVGVAPRPCTATAPGWTGSSCAIARRRACTGRGAAAGPGRHRRLTLALDEAVFGVAPGQVACLMDGDLVLGHGVIGHQ